MIYPLGIPIVVSMSQDYYMLYLNMFFFVKECVFIYLKSRWNIYSCENRVIIIFRDILHLKFLLILLFYFHAAETINFPGQLS